MRIIGFNFKKTSIERKKDAQGPMKINSNLEVEDIQKEKIDIVGDILKFHFIYNISYEPTVAKVSFEGEVLLIPTKPDDFKEIIKDWKKKKLNPEVKMYIFNYIMNKCNVKALGLEEDFGLPPHIPMPKLGNPKEVIQKSSGAATYAG